MLNLTPEDHLRTLCTALAEQGAPCREEAAARAVDGAPCGVAVMIRRSGDELYALRYRQEAAACLSGHEAAVYGLSEGGFVLLTGQQIPNYAADLPSAVTITPAGALAFLLDDGLCAATAVVTEDQAERLSQPNAWHPRVQQLARTLLHGGGHGAAQA